MNKIYLHINKVITEYLNEGIRPEHFVNYLNVHEDNFKYMYNKIYKRLTLDNVQFESETLKESLIDILQDNIYLINDLKEN